MSLNEAIRHAVDLGTLPWIRPLVGAYVHDFASVSGLFAGDPAQPAAWRDTVARVTQAPTDRAALVPILSRQLERRGAPTAAREAAAQFSDPASVAIITGQQAGLFGGPLYTLLKAITAVQLARRTQATLGVPAIAVFWVESEDHDWPEVNSTRVLDADLQARDVTLADLAGAGARPVASLVLDAGIGAAMQSLEAALAPSEFRSELLERLGRAYKPGAGMATAFAAWLDELLGHLGLVVFEADDPAAKPLVADLFVHELEQPGRTVALVRAAGASMRRLGHEPQVEPADDSVALFYMDGAGRRAIKQDAAGFTIGGAAHEAAALRQEARTHPERFSPNVLLRPLVQDRLFPTACYVGGPSELAYQAQLGGLYRDFGVAAPLLYSRASATLVDSAAAKFLDRAGVTLAALHAQDESLLNQLLAGLMPPELGRAFEDAAREISSRLAVIHEAVPAVDPTLTGATDTTRDRMLESLKTLQAKTIQASKRKDDTLRRQFQRTRALTFPGGAPQERAIGLTFFLNRYGAGLVDRLMETLPVETDKHYVVVI